MTAERPAMWRRIAGGLHYAFTWSRLTIHNWRESASKSDFIALFAAIVALFSFGFAIYQWASSERNEKIRAAIDLSTHYIDNKVDARILYNQYLTGVSSADVLFKAYSQLARTEYAASLLNRGKVARDYIAEAIICDIVKLPSDKKTLEAEDVRDEEANKFIRREPKACATSKPR